VHSDFERYAVWYATDFQERAIPEKGWVFLTKKDQDLENKTILGKRESWIGRRRPFL
jgi:hypothetical protein